ncbi:MAG: MBL fold metallo-hydrolase [Alphaproteobacteria bacterium]
MKLTILGCGPSGGVPLSHGEWGACDPKNPRNNRTRTSAALTFDNGQVWLIDASPDLRQQLLRERIKHVAGVLLTHNHADHINGLDDLRPFYFAYLQQIQVYADTKTLQELRGKFPYFFNQPEGTEAIYPLFFQFHELMLQPFEIEGVQVVPFVQNHGYSSSLGFRFPTFAYSTDVVSLSPEALALLEGIDLWVVDCMDIAPRPTHAHLELTLSWIEKIKPKKALLTHMGQAMDFETLCQKLPPGVEPAYDGLMLDL